MSKGEDIKQRLAIEFNILSQIAEEIKRELTVIQNLLGEVDIALSSIKKLYNLKGEEEILIPLAAGIYIRAKLEKQEKFIVPIGANIMLEKDYDDTMNFLSERKKELQQYLDRRTEELKNILSRLEEIRVGLSAR